MSKWTRDEKAVARALLSHPELAADTLILTQFDPPIINEELSHFLVSLHEAVGLRPEDPREALSTVPIRRDGVMWHLVFEVNCLPPRETFDPKIDRWNSEQIIKDFMGSKNLAATAAIRNRLRRVK